MLIDAQNSCLLIVDVQDKLLPAIADADELLANQCWLTEIATYLKQPQIISEQYPRGLGHTVEPLWERCSQTPALEKMSFSCAADPGCMAALAPYNQVVVIGIEAHVCVLQSVLELLQNGKQVFVVADAVGSRSELDKELALARMDSAGAHIVSREMVVFEWLRRAGSDEFRHISRTFLR